MLKSKVLGAPGPGPCCPAALPCLCISLRFTEHPVHSSAVQGSGEATLSSDRIAVS